MDQTPPSEENTKAGSGAERQAQRNGRARLGTHEETADQLTERPEECLSDTEQSKNDDVQCPKRFH